MAIDGFESRMRTATLPKGPQGQKRPADAIGLAVMIGKIATGEIEDATDATKGAAAQLGSLGGKARARKLSDSERKVIAKKAAAKRWGKASPAPAETECS